MIITSLTQISNMQSRRNARRLSHYVIYFGGNADEMSFLWSGEYKSN